jgi:hypothetical protein
MPVFGASVQWRLSHSWLPICVLQSLLQPVKSWVAGKTHIEQLMARMIEAGASTFITVDVCAAASCACCRYMNTQPPCKERFVPNATAFTWYARTFRLPETSKSRP